jgi:hypothetical protein
MGAFDGIPNILVPNDELDPDAAKAFRKKWKWDAHEMVIMRGAFSAGDQEAVGNAATKTTGKKNEVAYVGGTGQMKMLERMILDWTLTDHGRKVEVTPGAIRRLPANYSNPLLEMCDELATAMTEEEQADFFGSANGSISKKISETNLSLMKSSK